MAMSQALRLCPRAVVLPPDREAYSEVSRQVMAILRDVTPLVEPLSLDEAFLDVAGAPARARPAGGHRRARSGSASPTSSELTCSVGVAPTKFVAKLASARCKPDGMLVVAGGARARLPAPAAGHRAVGSRARTAESLHRLGIRTVGDLADTPVDTVRRAVGSAAADHLTALAAGIDPRPVQPHEVEKSISSDRTLEEDLTAEAEVRRELRRLAEDVGTRLRRRGFVARTIGIKIRFADFRTLTRVRTLPGWTDLTAEIDEVAVELYRGLGLDRPRVRLVGVKAENLRPADQAPEQLTLDVGPAPVEPRTREPAPAGSGPVPQTTTARWQAERAVDAARARFGAQAVQVGSLLAPSPPRSDESGAR